MEIAKSLLLSMIVLVLVLAIIMAMASSALDSNRNPDPQALQDALIDEEFRFEIKSATVNCTPMSDTQAQYKIELKEISSAKLSAEDSTPVDMIAVAESAGSIDICRTEIGQECNIKTEVTKTLQPSGFFTLTAPLPKGVGFMRITFWRSTQSIKNYFRDSERSFSELLDTNPESYIGSADFPLTKLEGTCPICIHLSEDNCKGEIGSDNNCEWSETEETSQCRKRGAE